MIPDKEKTDIIAGVTEGTLTWTGKQIKKFVRNLQSRKLAFIQDEDTINLVKSVKNKTEWQIIDEYIRDKNLRRLVQIGIVLRHLEGDKTKLQNLRGKIRHKYGEKGLHIAQLVQNKIFGKFLTLLTEQEMDKADIILSMEEILNEIEKYTLFVRSSDDAEEIIKTLDIRIIANIPSNLILCGSGLAIEKLDQIVEALEKNRSDYKVVTFEEKEKKIRKKTVFFVKVEK